MHALYGRIEAAGRIRSTILVVGESGTGKELVAHAIHSSGAAPDSRFLALNCAAVPRDLIESELFGYRRGAFSGAVGNYSGMFRAAEGGTLFLDEVTEMSPDTQAKLLRALQERMVRPIGSTEEVAVDIRLIASTNRDPEQAVRDGVLRKDLYYRLQAGMIEVPPMRERLGDLKLLVDHFVALHNARSPRQPPLRGVDPEALRAMNNYSWPGNVRELSNVIENAHIFGSAPSIGLNDLPAAIRNANLAETEKAPPPPATREGTAGMDDVEREMIKHALEVSRGNKVRAAAMLKISRKRLYSRLAKYNLT